MRKKRSFPLVLLGLIALALAAIFLPVREPLLQAASWMADRGPLGVILFGVFYGLTATLIPASLLSLAASFCFGPVVGFFVTSFGALAGACLGFGIARKLGRSWVEAKLAGHSSWLALDRAVQRKGWKIVLLTRLSPVFPYIALNYLFGASGVRFRDYFWASWVGMIPGAALFAVLGSAARNLAELGSERAPAPPSWIFWAGLALSLAVTIGISVWAKRVLQRS